jgi:hypothetical protein
MSHLLMYFPFFICDFSFFLIIYPFFLGNFPNFVVTLLRFGNKIDDLCN